MILRPILFNIYHAQSKADMLREATITLVLHFSAFYIDCPSSKGLEKRHEIVPNVIAGQC